MWIMDFEASGLDKQSFPIEVGVTDGVKGYQSLIRPVATWTFWCSMAEGVHGIPMAELRDAGRDVREVAVELNDVLAGESVYCDGIEWDSYWCRRLFDAAALAPAFMLKDIFELLASGSMTDLYHEEKHRLSTGEEYRAHRALDDASIIYRACNSALDRYDDRGF